MSKLSAFLHPVTTSEEKEVVISNRFQDESGQPVPFKIRALTQDCLLYTSPSPRDGLLSRMPSSA